MRIKLNRWLFDPENEIHIIDVVNGLLITETHGRLSRGHKQVWKEVKP